MIHFQVEQCDFRKTISRQIIQIAKSHSFIGPIVIYLYNSLTSALKINEVHTSRYQGAKMMY